MRNSRKEEVKGDLLRELLFLIYLRKKYDLHPDVKISTLKRLLGYSAGGIDYALKHSGFFEIKGNEVSLSRKGKEYVEKKILSPYRIFNPVGYFLIFIGALIFVQWYAYTIFKQLILFDWWSGLSLIIAGLILRFWLLPLLYWALKILKKL